MSAGVSTAVKVTDGGEGSSKSKSVKKMRIDTLLAGGIAGAAARTITAPLDRVKILMQTQKLTGENKYNSLVQSLVRVAKEDGIKGYWRGNMANCVRVVPYSATQFVTFEYLKNVSFLSSLPQIVQRLSFGAAAGMAASFVTHPLDVVRLRLAVEPELRGMYHAITSLWKEGRVTIQSMLCPFLV
jgi:solute carrier family 25 phosphate transporter 23/24/25/41